MAVRCVKNWTGRIRRSNGGNGYPRISSASRIASADTGASTTECKIGRAAGRDPCLESADDLVVSHHAREASSRV